MRRLQPNSFVPGLLLALSLVCAAGCKADPVGSLAMPGAYEPPRDYVEDPTNEISERPGKYAGGEENTFDHSDDLGMSGARDPFEILAQRQEEGPPEIRTRMHSCQKLQNAALREILVAFGVDIDATGDIETAGQLFKAGGGALGAANYDARVGESVVWTAAGAAKLFDIFVQAAPEIIANLPTVPQCQVDGVGPTMFDADDRCVPDAVTCLIGRPAGEEHLAICDSLVQSATDLDKGKKIAVASLLSAAHSCE
jgi:hypothetical protein